MHLLFRMYRLRVLNVQSKEICRVVFRGMSSIDRITRISSHLLRSTNVKPSFTSNTVMNASGIKTEATKEKASDNVMQHDDDDIALPNDYWTKDSLELFNKLQNEASQSKGLWVKEKRTPPSQTGNRPFPRCLWDQKGKLFEYCTYLNKRDEQLKGVLQFGPYTEGPKGFVHGGAISTVMDAILGICINCIGYRSVTANLSVDFKVGVPIGSTVLLKSRVDRVEGRKVFGYAEMKSPDESITYATSTALFIQVTKSTQEEEKKKEAA